MYHKSIQLDKKWQRKLLKCNKILLTRLKWTMQYGNALLLAHSFVHRCPRIEKKNKINFSKTFLYPYLLLFRLCIHARIEHMSNLFFLSIFAFFIIWPARIMTILAILNHRIDLYFDMPKIILLNMNRNRQILKKTTFHWHQ